MRGICGPRLASHPSSAPAGHLLPRGEGRIATAFLDRYLPPFGQDPNGRANRRLVAQAPGQKRAIIPSSSEPRRVDTKHLTTVDPLPVRGTRQGIGLSDRGDLGLAHPGWFGHGLLTRPSFATAVSDRRRVTWRPTVGRTAWSGEPRPTKRRMAGSGDHCG